MSTWYGAQPHGLICGYRYTAEQGGTPIDLSEAIEWLGAPPADGPSSLIWLHFDLADASAQPWMQNHLGLPQEFFDTLREGSRSTRIEDAQNHLVAVVNDVAYKFAFDSPEIATLWLSVNERIAVSARAHPLRSIDRLRVAVKEGARFSSTVDLLNHLMREQGDVLVGIVREATLKVDLIEDTLLHGRLKQQRAEFGKLRRVLVRLQRLLAPEPGALFRLLREPPPWIAANDLDELRHVTEEFSLVIRDLAALQERIRLLQEEIAAQVSEQTNRSLFTLTMVTVLALPINITTGFFGMNVGGGIRSRLRGRGAVRGRVHGDGGMVGLLGQGPILTSPVGREERRAGPCKCVPPCRRSVVNELSFAARKITGSRLSARTWKSTTRWQRWACPPA